MNLLFLASDDADETRTPVTPASAKRLVDAGFTVWVDADLPPLTEFPAAAFTDAGAEVVHTAPKRVDDATLLVRTLPPDRPTDLPSGLIHLSLFDPFCQPELVRLFRDQHVTALSPELLPRTTLAQRMDVLSSQASLAGYAAVIWAAGHLPQGLPMMMTPAGTLKPSRVFILGAGVAGLQAIATAKRLGARVEAFDTRPVVAEQVRSLGARFLQVDLGETGQTQDGYAKALTPEQVHQQQEAMATAVAQADIVITTAKLFGRPAPRLVTDGMVAAMRPGSVVVDLAADTGGNVEGIEAGKVITRHGITLYGPVELARAVPRHAGHLLAANFAAMLEHLKHPEQDRLRLEDEDPLIQGCVVTHEGAIVHPQVKEQTPEVAS